MKQIVFSNIDMRYRLIIEAADNGQDITRYFVRLIDADQDDDKQNPLWIIEPINDGVYQLTFEQIICREFVMFGSLAECLNAVAEASKQEIGRRQ